MFDKNKRYEEATAKLVNQARNMRLPPHWTDTSYRLALMTAISREHFKDPVVRMNVLLPQHEQRRIAEGNFSQGFCGPISYVYHHYFRLEGLPLFYMRQIDERTPGWDFGSHVYLESAVDKSIFDPTFDQFYDEMGNYIEIPYDLGEYVNGNFKFLRGINFAAFHDIDLHWDGSASQPLHNYDKVLRELIKEK